MYTDAEVDDYISEVLADTQWQSEKQTVPEFLTEFISAQPVRLVSNGREVNLDKADLMHPFLAFSRRRRTKAYAENLVWDSKEKKYMATGPPLEIPKDYIGWFELVHQGSPANKACQTTIADIVATKCRQFLVRTTVIAHLAADNNNEDNDLQLGEEARIYPGEILQVREVVAKKWKTQAVDSSDLPAGKKKKPAPETKFLQCVDTKDQVLYLPMAHPGQFYGLWSSEMKSSRTPRTDLAYYIYDMLNFGFPFLVKIVFGWPPVDFGDFSGFLRILGINRPDSLILRSMKPGSCVVLELPMDADVKIEKMSNPDILSGNKAFERILGHSCDRIYPYLIGMKHMDTKYPVAMTPGDKDSGSAPTDKNKGVCRMARPRNMNHFSPLDIFPPLDEPVRKVADSWALSFKDPDFKASGHGELRDSESMLSPEQHVEDESAKGPPSRQKSLIGKVGDALEGMRMDNRNHSGGRRRDQIWNKRADMEQVLLEREADC